MTLVFRAPVACLVTALLAISAGPADAQTDKSPRGNLAAALEALIATGSTGHTTHDAGEWLQLAVSDAIKSGDREIERLAVRAAFPVQAHITRPVSPTDALPQIEIGTHSVLNVPRPIGYSAQILAAFDGAGFVPVHEVRSGSNQSWRVDTGLGRAAGLPGLHVVRLKARLTFGDPARDARASWTEVRDLPDLFYGVYDVQPEAGSVDVRALVYGPASVAARELDPALGDEPFAIWLAGTLSTRRTRTDPANPDWMSQYCSERTSEAGVPPVSTAVCSVVYFQVRGHIGQIWFRTADVHVTDAGVTWERASPPRFEGFVILESAPESQRLSMLPMVLDTEPSLRPIGDVSISPDDIVVVPPDPKAGAPFSATITVRNQGSGDLFKVAVHVTLATSPNDRGASRQFVVDLPAQGSADIKLEGAFPQGYGVVLAHAMQMTEHSPFESWTPDPTPEDACAFRIVNPRAAPPDTSSPSTLPPASAAGSNKPGNYGVLSHAVNQQRREIGIRMALGARAGDVVSQMLRQALGMIVVGLAAGLLGAFGVTRVMRSLLFEVSALDPVALITAGVAMALVGLLAALIPAGRAARVNPVAVLRSEG